MIKSSLLYGSETWRMTKNLKSKLEAMEMDAMKRVAGISRLERVRKEMKRKMDIEETIKEDIERRQI